MVRLLPGSELLPPTRMDDRAVVGLQAPPKTRGQEFPRGISRAAQPGCGLIAGCLFILCKQLAFTSLPRHLLPPEWPASS